MGDKKLLTKIYYENKAINNGISKLMNIIFIAILGNINIQAKENDDVLLKGLSKFGLFLSVIVLVLTTISDVVCYRDKKRDLDEIEENK